jgi:uncharacterized protein (DUF2252 family)
MAGAQGRSVTNSDQANGSTPDPKGRRPAGPSRSVSARATAVSIEARRERGRAERTRLPRGSHEDFIPSANRSDPVTVLEQQGVDRLPELLPIRYGRMLRSPFAFYRGSAALMASDLGHMPHTCLTAQICGDAHLVNFGFFGSPERQLVFDINDFDETLLGPWEWDVKRLATSAVLAARELGFSAAVSRDIARSSVRSYRERMAELAEMSAMEVWYSHVTADSVVALIDDRRRRDIAIGRMQKARARSSRHAVAKYTEVIAGKLRVKENPPLVERLPEEEVAAVIQPVFRKYAQSLQDDRRHLLDQYRYVDSARRVGGLGSVGTRSYIVVLTGRDETDPLVLQLKEATGSVLTPFLPPTRYRNEAQRVVEGQRLIQGVSDVFLGWLRHSNGRTFYFRQLYDMKLSAEIVEMNKSMLGQYAGLCGELLARAHAKSGDPVAISAYLGKGDRFDQAVVDFAVRYADQTERDFEALERAAAAGRVPVETGV